MKQTKINIKALKFICVVLPLIYLIMISVTLTSDIPYHDIGDDDAVFPNRR